MLGAIIGDIAGSRFEFHNRKTKDFELFHPDCRFTDDTVMTLAVASALMDQEGELEDRFVRHMQRLGRAYPNAGYGGRFYDWIFAVDPAPYNSWGNGSAMRVSSVGWLYDTLEKTREVARLTAEVTHNHPEGIKGAEATAAAIYLARTGATKDEIKDYIIKEFGYDLSRTLDEIRPTYHHVESCQQTVPEAITAFLEGNDFEDVVRCAVSLGGDCDTLTCIAAGIAEGVYGVPDKYRKETIKRMEPDMVQVYEAFLRHRK